MIDEYHNVCEPYPTDTSKYPQSIPTNSKRTAQTSFMTITNSKNHF